MRGSDPGRVQVTESSEILWLVRYAVGFLCLAFGLAASALLVKAWESQSWSKAEGRVTQCRVLAISGVAPIYFVSVCYSYEIDGNSYSGSRLQFGHQIDGLPRSRAATIANRLREGTTVTVYYNPSVPADSTLFREAATSVYILAPLGVVLSVLLVCLIEWPDPVINR